MPDTKISALPAAPAVGTEDLFPLVQGTGGDAETRRASIGQLATRILADRALHVRDFGAVGDGLADDAPAIQAAVNALAASGGGVLLFGPRHYRLASQVVVDGVAVLFQGAGFQQGAAAGAGTWFLIDVAGFTPFTFSGAAAAGSAMRDLAFRQSHPAPGTGWAPTDYGHLVRVIGCPGEIAFETLFLCGVNRGIYCDNSAGLRVRGLAGQVFANGIEIDRCSAAPRIEGVRFRPAYSADDNVVRWQQANQDSIILRRCDGAFLDGIEVLGARSALRLASSSAGVATRVHLGSLAAQNVRNGIWADGAGSTAMIATATIQGELYNGGGVPFTGSAGVLVEANDVHLRFGALRVDKAESNALRATAAAGRIDIFALRIETWNSLADGAAAIHLANVATGTPNQVFLGSPAIANGGGSGPLVTAGSNGAVAMMAPAGRVARPGLAVGSQDMGLWAPAATELAAVAGGVEVLRATALGTVTLGGAPGAHALGVTTPAATVNELRVTGSAAGNPVTIAAQGSDTNIQLRLASKGNAVVQLQSRSKAAFEAYAIANNAVNYLRAAAVVTGSSPPLQAQGSDTNVGIDIQGKGTGAISLTSNGAVALAASNPASSVNSVAVSGAATGGTPLLAAQGSDANVTLALGAKGSGAVQSAAPFQLPSYTVAGLPSAATYPRCLVYVSNGTANKRLAVSDGSAWRWPDGAVVS